MRIISTISDDEYIEELYKNNKLIERKILPIKSWFNLEDLIYDMDLYYHKNNTNDNLYFSHIINCNINIYSKLDKKIRGQYLYNKYGDYCELFQILYDYTINKYVENDTIKKIENKDYIQEIKSNIDILKNDKIIDDVLYNIGKKLRTYYGIRYGYDKDIYTPLSILEEDYRLLKNEEERLDLLKDVIDDERYRDILQLLMKFTTN